MLHVLLTTLLWVNIATISNSLAENTAPQGFQSFEEFMKALDEMPVEKFAKLGNTTGTGNISLWYAWIPRDQPEKFPAWNAKLKNLPTFGFVHNPSLLEVSLPKALPLPGKPFETLEEFVAAIQDDPIDVFQKRLNSTSKESFTRWRDLLAKNDLETLKLAAEKFQKVKSIGYGTPHWFTPDLFASQHYIGFGTRDSPRALATFEEFMDLIHPESLAELKARAFYTPAAKLNAWAKKLKTTNLNLYMLFTTAHEISPKVGFLREGEIREIVDRRFRGQTCDLTERLAHLLIKK